MNFEWREDSLNPFLTPPNKALSNYQFGKQNPLKADGDFETINSQSSIFKPIPLPDDILGFDPIPSDSRFQFENPLTMQIPSNSQTNFSEFLANQEPMSIPLNGQNNQYPYQNTNNNNSFNIDNYLKGSNTDYNDNDFLGSEMNLNLNYNGNINGKENDIEKVMLDLGISEAPVQSQTTQPKKTHRRQLSGSEIFGIVGSADNLQLSIPGLETQFLGKKPLYKDIKSYDNLEIFNNANIDNINVPPIDMGLDVIDIAMGLNNNYNLDINSGMNIETNYNMNMNVNLNSNSNINMNNKVINNNPSTPIKAPTPSSRKEKLDYYVSSGNPNSYKFPSPPKGSFTNKPITQQNISKIPTESSNSLAKVKSSNSNILDNFLTDESSPSKTNLPTPAPTSPLNSVAMSSPLKNNFQTPKQGSPRKIFVHTQFTSGKKVADETIVLDDDDKDRTISEMATPLNGKVNILNMQTPTKKKKLLTRLQNCEDASLLGSPMKKNIFTHKSIKGPNKTAIRKKPTITSTLASGSLEQYFIGPTREGKYICKFFDKEIQGVCNREFHRISNTRAHIQTHLSDRPFVCDECGKAFVRNHDLKRHKMGHKAAGNVCPCGKGFPRADALKRHRARNICVGGFNNKGAVSKPEATEGKAVNKKLSDKIIASINNNPNSIQVKDINKQEDNKPKQPKQPQTDHQHNCQNQSCNHQHHNHNYNDSKDSYDYKNYQPSQGTSKPISQPKSNCPDELELFEFDEIPGVDNNFSFNMEDSIVI